MDKIYRFEVYPSYTTGDLEYIVKYYDIPVIGSGETVEGAIEEARGNLEFYLEYCEEKGVALPQPSVHDKKDDFSGKITFRTSKTMHSKIDERAKKEGISINNLLNEAVSTYININDYSDKVAKECAKEIVSESVTVMNEVYNNYYKIEYMEVAKNKNSKIFIS